MRAREAMWVVTCLGFFCCRLSPHLTVIPFEKKFCRIQVLYNIVGLCSLFVTCVHVANREQDPIVLYKTRILYNFFSFPSLPPLLHTHVAPSFIAFSLPPRRVLPLIVVVPFGRPPSSSPTAPVAQPFATKSPLWSPASSHSRVGAGRMQRPTQLGFPSSPPGATLVVVPLFQIAFMVTCFPVEPRLRPPSSKALKSVTYLPSLSSGVLDGGSVEEQRSSSLWKVVREDLKHYHRLKCVCFHLSCS
jgi:hypothetical protein